MIEQKDITDQVMKLGFEQMTVDEQEMLIDSLAGKRDVPGREGRIARCVWK